MIVAMLASLALASIALATPLPSRPSPLTRRLSPIYGGRREGLRPLRSNGLPDKSTDLPKYQEDLEKKFVEKRVEMLDEDQDFKSKASPIGSVGGTAPLGKYWDPASFSREADANQVKRYREAELTHGRVAMLGALGFLTQEKFHPLFGGDIDGPAVYHFQKIQEMSPLFWYPVFLAIAIAELGRARIGWEEPSGGSIFGLREGYEPGNLGFDPLGLYPSDPKAAIDMKNKELNNGRLAMVGLLGMIVQELVTGKPIAS